MPLPGTPPYPSYLHTHFHPGRLSVIPRLRGLEVPDPAKCRLLDIGCGDATSLLFFAEEFPAARFAGFDLDAGLIRSGQAAARDLGLSNLDLAARDLLEIDRSLGEFDYIAAHGFYSWVPEPVRERLWTLLDELLAPNGLVYISFNAYPGSHFREASRRLLAHHTRHLGDAPSVIRESQGLLRFLASLAPEGHLYRQLLKEEAEAMLDRQPEQIFFDELSDCYYPFYLSDFLGRAARAGFAYVGESSWAAMTPDLFPAPIRDTLTRIPDWPERMQYRDFFEGCRFHRVILCRAGLRPGEFAPERLAGSWIAGSLSQTAEGCFVTPEGREIRSSHPETVEILARLSAASPHPLPFDDLSAASPRHAAALVMDLWARDAATVSLTPPRAAAEPGALPAASPLIRYRARQPGDIHSLFGQTVEFQDPRDRRLLELLDGTRDRAELAAAAGLAPDDLEARLAFLARFGFLLA
jgi:SAM-dependent methyltransferase